MEPRLKLLTLPKGSVIYREGDGNNGKMYVVHDGIVTAKMTVQGREQVVYQCTQGDIIGEVSFLTGEPRTATCEVSTAEAHVYELTNETFEEMIAQDPKVAIKVIRSLSDRLRSVERRFEQS
ncbi:MAG: Crp/Fnr family transcriptional regulator [Acidobacteriota bacterium]